MPLNGVFKFFLNGYYTNRKEAPEVQIQKTKETTVGIKDSTEVRVIGN